MRYFSILPLLILTIHSRPLWACDNTTIQNGGTHNCATLDLTGTITFPANSPALIINVSGDVTINANIILDGAPGGKISVLGPSTDGGAGGPGAGHGGGLDLGSPQGGSDALPSSGKAGGSAVTCAGGGGGAGLVTNGYDGTACDQGNGGDGGEKGYALTATDLDFTNPANFRGGFGGGASGDNGNDIGTGGGGAGGIYIKATGNILINGTISAKGGNGGSVTASNDGGGGGGGSGGIIWIESAGKITNNAVFDLAGGQGGNSPGGKGGNGAAGFYKLTDADNVIDGIGTGTSTSGQNLTSSISCGSVGDEKNSSNQIFQIISGFAFIWIFNAFKKRFLKLFP